MVSVEPILSKKMWDSFVGIGYGGLGMFFSFAHRHYIKEGWVEYFYDFLRS
jgi:hypothetical protein